MTLRTSRTWHRDLSDGGYVAANLTLNCYTHLRTEDIRGTLKPLPQKTETPATGTEAVATHKTGTAPEVDAGTCHNGRHNVTGSSCQNTAESGDTKEAGNVGLTEIQNTREPATTGDSDRSGRDVPERGGQEEVVGRAGVEPATPGFSVLCSTN